MPPLPRLQRSQSEPSGASSVRPRRVDPTRHRQPAYSLARKSTYRLEYPFSFNSNPGPGDYIWTDNDPHRIRRFSDEARANPAPRWSTWVDKSGTPSTFLMGRGACNVGPQAKYQWKDYMSEGNCISRLACHKMPSSSKYTLSKASRCDSRQKEGRERSFVRFKQSDFGVGQWRMAERTDFGMLSPGPAGYLAYTTFG